MAAPDPQQILSYLDRALADEYLLDRLREFIGDTRTATRRAQRRGARDQRAQRSALNALSALAAAAREAHQPEPPPRHRGRRLIVLAGVTAATYAAFQRLRPREMWKTASAPASSSP